MYCLAVIRNGRDRNESSDSCTCGVFTPCSSVWAVFRSTGQAAQDSHAAMNKRGTEAMGFSQTDTTHHFLLTANGGAIQV